MEKNDVDKEMNRKFWHLIMYRIVNNKEVITYIKEELLLLKYKDIDTSRSMGAQMLILDFLCKITS